MPLFLAALVSCKSNDDLQDENPFLNVPPVNVSLSLNLPQYDALKFPGNSVAVNGGVRGIVVYNVNNDLYTAFDLSDPNHLPSDCSGMTVSGAAASCPCTNDDNSYNLVTGEHATTPNAYPMVFYRARRSGNTIVVSN